MKRFARDGGVPVASLGHFGDDRLRAPAGERRIAGYRVAAQVATVVNDRALVDPALEHMNGPELTRLGYQFPECYLEAFATGWPAPPGIKSFALPGSDLVLQFHTVDEANAILNNVRVPWSLDDLAIEIRVLSQKA